MFIIAIGFIEVYVSGVTTAVVVIIAICFIEVDVSGVTTAVVVHWAKIIFTGKMYW